MSGCYSLRRALLVVGGAVALAFPARADMLILKDERIVVGVVREEKGHYLLVATRDAQTRPVEYPRDRVARWLAGADERAAIDAIESVDTLLRLSEDYHTAGLESLAGRCLTLAAQRDPGLADRPRGQGSDVLREFWNRTLLQIRQRRADDSKAEDQIGLARWAYDAGLVTEATDLLRRARQIEPGRGEIAELAREWGVDLRPSAEIDLRPAVRETLVWAQIMDESVIVLPKEGHRFVGIPFRYRTDVSHDIRRAAFDVRSASGTSVRFLGFRAMFWEDREPVFSQRPTDPIYERLQISVSDETGTTSLVGVNLSHSARSGTEKDAGPTIATRNRIACTGWAAVILEVPNSVDTLTVSIARGVPEGIQVGLLEKAHLTRGGARSSEASEWVRHLSDGSPAAAMLALRCLAVIRRDIQSNQYAAWSLGVDGAIIAALQRLDGAALREAWRCLIDHGPLPVETAAAIRSAGPEVHGRLIGFVTDELNRAPTGPHATANAVAVLGAILQSDDIGACEAAVDFLAAGAPDAAYDALISASVTARASAIARCRTLNDPAVRQRIVRALAVRAAPTDAETLSRLIKQDRVLITSPSDEILVRIRNTTNPGERENLLAMLQGLSLVPVLRTPIMLQILDEVSAASAPDSLRARGALLAADQSRFRSSAARGGSFPVCLPAEHADPVVRALCRAIEYGPDEIRVTAVLALLREGHVQTAEEGIRKTLGSSRARGEFIDALCREPEASRIDGVLALLARLASLPDFGPRRLLEHMRALAQSRPPHEASRVNLVVKAAIPWEAMADYSVSEDAALARLAADWTIRLAHLSPQDRRQFLHATDRNARSDRLRSANSRLGRIALGRYDIIVMLELAWPVPRSADAVASNWLPPQRITLSGGEAQLRSPDLGRQFHVYVGDQLRGMGTVPVGGAGLPQADDTALRLSPAPEGSILAGVRVPGEAPGPYLLEPGEVGPSSKPGTINLDVSEILRSAIERDPAASAFATQAKLIVPVNLRVSLKYVGFGTYVGVGARRTIGAPAPGAADLPALVNFVIMLERRDDDQTGTDAGPARADASANPGSPPSSRR